MRGTLRLFSSQHWLHRIIPAHAGNSHGRAIASTRSPDHPRACGELPAWPRRSRTRSPDHPRACGELHGSVRFQSYVSGSSPRMRGTLERIHAPELRRRIIPAHAGNSTRFGSGKPGPSDHPRACGELAAESFIPLFVPGSSPRMRGTLDIKPSRRDRMRIIPAHAGNSRQQANRERTISDHPRACGELFLKSAFMSCPSGSSPRMRGTLGCDLGIDALRRIIPAHAGNSATVPSASASSSDHPRACGELIGGVSASASNTGSSPRMRGTLSRIQSESGSSRIIPAHAGNSF